MKKYIAKSAAAAFLLAASVSHTAASTASAVQDDPSMSLNFGVLCGYELVRDVVKSYKEQELSTSGGSGAMSFGAKIGLEIPLTDMFSATAHLFVDYSSYEQSFKNSNAQNEGVDNTKQIKQNNPIQLSQQQQLAELVTVKPNSNVGHKNILRDVLKNNIGGVIAGMQNAERDGCFKVQYCGTTIECQLNSDVLRKNRDNIEKVIKEYDPNAKLWVGNQLSQMQEIFLNDVLVKPNGQNLLAAVDPRGDNNYTLINKSVIVSYAAADPDFVQTAFNALTTTSKGLYNVIPNSMEKSLFLFTQAAMGHNYASAVAGGAGPTITPTPTADRTLTVANINLDILKKVILTHHSDENFKRILASKAFIQNYNPQTHGGGDLLKNMLLMSGKQEESHIHVSDDVVKAIAKAIAGDKALLSTVGTTPQSDDDDVVVNTKDNKLKTTNIRIGITPAIQFAPFSTDDLSVYFRVGPSLAYNIMSVGDAQEQDKAKFITVDAHAGVGMKYKIAGDTAALNVGLSYDSKNMFNFKTENKITLEKSEEDVQLSTGHAISLNVGFHINI